MLLDYVVAVRALVDGLGSHLNGLGWLAQIENNKDGFRRRLALRHEGNDFSHPEARPILFLKILVQPS